MSTTSGIIYFATATSGSGNSNNEITNCNLTNNSGSRPINVIFSSGSSSYVNTTNNISNNNIYDFLNTGASSNAIFLSSNSTDFTISGNSFYETSTTLSATAANTYRMINIDNTSGNNFIITNNYFGGQSASCGGSALTISGAFAHLFQVIYLRVATTTESSIQNNVIKNINYSTTSSTPWAGIYIALGAVNIGTVTGNTIGETTGTGSIIITNTTANSNSYGIVIYSSGSIDIQNNSIGSITAVGSSSTYHNIVAIYKMLVSGTWTVSNNTIGSTSTSNSIQASSPATTASKGQMVIGIRSYCSGSSTYNNNTISGLYNAYNGGLTTARTRGIETTRGSNTITNNTIQNISTTSGQEYYNVSASVIGISQLSNINGSTQLLDGNTIHNLSNTNTTKKVDVYGIYTAGSTTGSNTISNNFIYGLYLSTTYMDGKIEGILIYKGVTTVYNNIINFGGQTSTGNLFYGIYDQCDAGSNSTIYFNTVYIGGSVTSSPETSSTFALYSNANTSTRDYRNNALFNDRTGGSVGKHYAIYLAGSTSLTNNYNNYFVSSTGILGKIGSTNYSSLDASWKAASGGDANSVNINPGFMIGGSTNPDDYMPATTLAGLAGLGITKDIIDINRATVPTIGAVERGPFWVGTTSTDYNTASNWSNNAVPTSGSNLFFADNPDRSCDLDMNRTIGAIIINQSTDKLVVNGYDLTIKGTLALSNGGQIDATASSSSVILESTFSQSIPDGGFYNNEVYDITINNANNIELNGSLRLINSITASSGRLDATTNTSTFIYAGTSEQTIESNIFLNDKFDNLTIDNSSGVVLNADFTVNGNLIINSGKVLTLTATKNLEVIGSITNSAGSAGLILSSNSSGIAELLHNTSSIAATVERYLSGASESWHFISCPVSNQSISGTWLPSGTYTNGTGYDLFLWNEPSTCWIYKLNTSSTINWSTIHPSSNFDIGRGYLYSVQESLPTKDFVGNLNTGTINIPLTYSGDNSELKGFVLIGNPYPSSIDWKAASGWTRSNLENSGGGYNIWVWNPTANNYGVYNSADIDDTGTNSVSRYIASTQGFFVRASGTGNITMTNSVRVLKGSGNLLRTRPLEKDKLKLSIISDSGFGSDEVILKFGYFENEKGAPKLFSEVVSAPSLYIPYSSESLSVLNLTNTQENPIIPISFMPGANGDYTINCDFDLDRFDIVMLEDTKNKYIQNMKVNQTYNFSAEKTDNTDRFKLHFGAIDNDFGDELPARIYSDGNQLIIDMLLVANDAQITICDIMGRVILQQEYSAETQHNISLNVKTQVLIVHLENENGRLTRKILWYL